MTTIHSGATRRDRISRFVWRTPATRGRNVIVTIRTIRVAARPLRRLPVKPVFPNNVFDAGPRQDFKTFSGIPDFFFPDRSNANSFLP